MSDIKVEAKPVEAQAESKAAPKVAFKRHLLFIGESAPPAALSAHLAQCGGLYQIKDASIKSDKTLGLSQYKADFLWVTYNKRSKRWLLGDSKYPGVLKNNKKYEVLLVPDKSNKKAFIDDVVAVIKLHNKFTVKISHLSSKLASDSARDRFFQLQDADSVDALPQKKFFGLLKRNRRGKDYHRDAVALIFTAIVTMGLRRGLKQYKLNMLTCSNIDDAATYLCAQKSEQQEAQDAKKAAAVAEKAAAKAVKDAAKAEKKATKEAAKLAEKAEKEQKVAEKKAEKEAAKLAKAEAKAAELAAKALAKADAAAKVAALASEPDADAEEAEVPVPTA
jgi:hypothetical protein